MVLACSTLHKFVNNTRMKMATITLVSTSIINSRFFIYLCKTILTYSKKSNRLQACTWTDFIVGKSNKTVHTIHETVSHHLIKMFQYNWTRMYDVKQLQETLSTQNYCNRRGIKKTKHINTAWVLSHRTLQKNKISIQILCSPTQ